MNMNLDFKIKRISNPNDKDYLTALKIYVDVTPIVIKTNSNEISYWLEHTNDSFELMVFALYMNDVIIGFAMMSYTKKQKLFIIDYIALKTEYRVNTTFLSFLNLMQSYVSEEGYDFRYYIVEISNKQKGKAIDRESLFFRKLLCLEGFIKTAETYMTPPLGNENDSVFEAYLFIKSNDVIGNLSKETYLDIVKAIYHDYYVKWYLPFLLPQEMMAYQNKINVGYKRIEESLQKTTDCSMIPFNCPLLTSGELNNTYSNLPVVKKSIKESYL